MRLHPSLLLLVTALVQACASAPPSPVAPTPHGMTLEEEATILRLEDRREFDADLANKWLTHPNSIHRARMALALGRIGQATFVDTSGNGEKDPGERMAGVDLLASLVTDSDPNVRRTAAFALGETGDSAAIDPLVTLTSDQEHADVAAEAVEALSKLAANVELPRYLTLTGPSVREGVRARAVRFLFRFNSDAASVAAAQLLDAPPSIRREAAYSLSRRPLAAARGRLELLLTDSDTLIRSYAARAIGRIADPESLPALLSAIGDPHPWVRTNAAVAIGQIAAKDAASIERVASLPNLAKMLALSEDPDPGTRVMSIEPLSYFAVKNTLARTRLMQIAENGSKWERELAAGVIAARMGPEGVGDLEKAAPWMLVRILEAAPGSAWGAALRAKYATHTDVLVRAAAILAIPDAGADAEVSVIRAAMNDDDVIVRANAIERYGNVKVENAGTRLAALTQAETRARGDRLNDARLAAIRAMAGVGDPAREQRLRALLSDSDPVARRLGADLLVEILKKNRPQFTPLPITRSMGDYIEIARWAREPHTATIHMARGDIELVLLPQDAAVTAKNFADLARKGYFNNSTFMRVVPNFVIQGGDPRNDMNGGPGYSIRDEINLQKYTRGAVGMALSGPDTGGSQFFITHSPTPHLDGGYTIFARVVGGMSGVVDQTERGDRVNTIRIDEKKPAANVDFAPVQKTPLPTEVGVVRPEHLLEFVPEYLERKDQYVPDDTVVELIAAALQNGDRIEVVLGTWCPDSQREVPRFLKILDVLRFKYSREIPVQYLAVDRSKKSPAKLVEGRSIEKVATFIIYRNEREIGRIEETPTGVFEDHLLQILATRP